MLGAVPVEQELAGQIAALMPGTGYDVDHLECGGAVFQINQPARDMLFNGQQSIHQAYLDEAGPCVTNLNYYVDDIVHARDLLSSMGAAVHIEGPSGIARALGDYGPANTRPGGDERPFLFMGTRHLIGFDLEIMEPNFLSFSRQTAQFPAFVEPRPAPNGDIRLHRLVAVVPDIGRTYDAICAIFAPASRSKPYDQRDEASCKAFRIGLGGMEIEYRQPEGTGGMLAGHLDRFGPGIAQIAFGCAARSDLVSRTSEWRHVTGESDEAIGRPQASPDCHFAECRSVIGFDIIVEDPEIDPAITT